MLRKRRVLLVFFLTTTLLVFGVVGAWVRAQVIVVVQPPVVSEEEFVGPLLGWKNAKTDYSCAGTAGSDATTCLQNAINGLSTSNPVLWIPSGEYDISGPLVTNSGKQGVAIYCQDPRTTKLKWTGTSNPTITASITGTTMTVTAGAANVQVGDLLEDATGSIWGTRVDSGSGSTWTVSGGGTTASESITLLPPMISLGNVFFSKINRCTFDGNNGGAVAINDYNPENINFDSGNEYSDDTFTNLAAGFLCGIGGPNQGCSEVTMLRDAFTSIHQASPYQGVGVMTGNFNAADVWVWWSTFTNVDVGLANILYLHGGATANGAGQFDAFQNIFQNSGNGGSGGADIQTDNTQFRVYVGNYSTGSQQFLNEASLGATELTTIKDNTILDTVQSQAILLGNFGPSSLIHNTIRSLAGATAPVVNMSNSTSDLLSVGNTFTVGSLATPCSASAPVNSQRCHEIVSGTYPDRVVSRSTINPSPPTLPPLPPNNSRQIYEVGTCAAFETNCHSNASIAAAVSAALASGATKPVVHIPAGSYTASINIPACTGTPNGCDVQIIGDGFNTLLTASGTTSVIVLNGPSNAVARDLQLDGNANQADAIDITNADQPGSRVFIQSGDLSVDNSGRLTTANNLWSDGLNNTLIEAHNLGNGHGTGNGVKVTAGANGGQTNIFLGSGVGDFNIYNVSGSGRLVASGVWIDNNEVGAHQFLNATGSGAISIYGGWAFVNLGTGGICNLATPPIVGFSNFTGTAAILQESSGNQGGAPDTINWASSGSETNGSLLIAGDAGCGTTWWNDTSSPSDTSELLNSWEVPLSGANSQIAESCVNTSCASLSGSVISTQLTQMITTNPIFPTALASGVTDVGLYRVAVRNAVNGIHVQH